MSRIKEWIERKRQGLGRVGAVLAILLGVVASASPGLARLICLPLFWIVVIMAFALVWEDIPKTRAAFGYGVVCGVLLLAFLCGSIYLLDPGILLAHPARSPISGHIDSTIIGVEPYGSRIALIATIANSGDKSVVVDPSSWRLRVKRQNGEQYVGDPLTFEPLTKICIDGGSARKFASKDALYTKAANGVPSGDFAQGVLAFAFRGIPKYYLTDPTNTLELTARTVSGDAIDVSTTISDLENAENRLEVFTGLTYPVPVQCQEAKLNKTQTGGSHATPRGAGAKTVPGSKGKR